MMFVLRVLDRRYQKNNVRRDSNRCVRAKLPVVRRYRRRVVWLAVRKPKVARLFCVTAVPGSHVILSTMCTWASCSLCGLAWVSEYRATQSEHVGMNTWNLEESCNRWELMHYANKCCPAPIILDIAYDATTRPMRHRPGKVALSPGKVRPIYSYSIKVSQHVKITS